MTKIKMVALDLDGTVFNDNKEVTRRTRETIERAVHAGVVVVPATGRPIIGLPKDVMSIEGITYAVTCNGGAVYDMSTQKLMVHDPIPYEQAAEIVRVQRALGNAPEIYAYGKCFIDAEAKEQLLVSGIPQVLKEYVKVSRTPVDDLASYAIQEKMDADKMHMLFDPGDPVRRAEAFESMKQFDRLIVGSAIPYNMEINAATADKGTALINLGKLLGIEKEEIMAIGDGFNDMTMLQSIGFPVAMGNGVAELKAVAKAITTDNNHDGVADAIEKYVLI